MVELRSVIEAILFSAQKALTLKEIRSAFTEARDEESSELVRGFRRVKETQIEEAIAGLQAEYAAQNRSFTVQQVAGAWQVVTLPPFAPWVRPMMNEARASRLSQAALETLAIIAYRQPITRADIEGVRGVAVDGVMQTLLERGLVTITGRAEVPGRPMLFGTTRRFLEYFGLADLSELPNATELRRLQTPAAEISRNAEATAGASDAAPPDPGAEEASDARDPGSGEKEAPHGNDSLVEKAD
ncbi:MAG: SMC-Scp complex subunit ScpB [Verrucomicrobiae bacterium]|nr:SMC-Scp complex subunit ScpB [Verrucomicrobiae bacterium]